MFEEDHISVWLRAADQLERSSFSASNPGGGELLHTIIVVLSELQGNIADGLLRSYLRRGVCLVFL